VAREDAEIFDGGIPEEGGRVGAEAARPCCMMVESLHPTGSAASLPFPNPRAALQGIGGGDGGGGGDGHGCIHGAQAPVQTSPPKRIAKTLSTALHSSSTAHPSPRFMLSGIAPFCSQKLRSSGESSHSS